MSATTDRRVALDIEVEILTDADTSVPELVVNNDLVTADQARARLTESQRTLDSARTVVVAYDETVKLGHYPWCDVGACGPSSEDGVETEHLGEWLTLGEPGDCSGSSIKLRHPDMGFLSAQIRHDTNISNRDGTPAAPDVLLTFEGNSCALDAVQLDAFIGQVGRFYAGLVEMRAQLDDNLAGS